MRTINSIKFEVSCSFLFLFKNNDICNDTENENNLRK